MTAPPTPFGPDRLIEQASVETGLDDFGPPGFREGLDVLCETYRAAPLNELGVAYKQRLLHNLLTTRLRLAALLARKPEIRSRRVAAPVFIVGPPRSGTTALHRVLAADPRIRTLARWECVHPDPSGAAPGAPDPRLEAMRAQLARTRGSAMAVIRYVDPDLPDECFTFLQLSMVIAEAGEGVWQPFAGWAAACDRSAAYDWYADVLRVVDWQRPGERWLLKSPAHLESVALIAQRFPDATFVWTHRDPVASAASMCSLAATSTAPFAEVDPHEIGTPILAGLTRLVERGLAARQALGEDRFVDVSYDDIVADQAAVAEEVARRAGLPPDPEARERMREFAAANPQHARGVHTYALEEYGLDAAGVRERFAAYTARFMPEG